MRSVELWGLLILAAKRQVRLDSASLDELGITQGADLEKSIIEIREFCEFRSIPDLTLAFGLEPLESVWSYDWLSQEIPRDPSEDVNYSPTWFLNGVEHLRRGREAATRATSDLVSKYWPVIAKAVREKMQPLPEKVLSDRELVEQIARRVYPFLPTVVQLIVSEKDFVQVCLDNAKLILEMYSRRLGGES